MKRYYFHYADGKTILDELGTELPDIHAVRLEALRTTREMMLKPGPRFWAGEPHRLWVTDAPNAAGRTILDLELSVR